MHSETVNPALLKVSTPECQQEIERKLQALLYLGKPPRVRNGIFQKSAYAHIGNHPHIPFGYNDLLVGVKGSQNPVLLFKEEQKCYLGLLDNNEQVVKRVMLTHCQCTSVR